MNLSLPVISVKKPLGYVLYRGKSLFNGKPIVVVAIGFGRSDNIKTGNMLQIYILADKQSPITSYQSGNDDTNCGDCKHKSLASGNYGTCYVRIDSGPNMVWKSYQNNRYEDISNNQEKIKEVFKGQNVRFGAYGDPSLMGFELVSTIASVANNWTGYTHQYKKKQFAWTKEFFMASCDSEVDFIAAKKAGFRAFRIRIEDEPLLKHEMICPASAEGGKRLQCNSCFSCNGGESKANVAIIVHGIGYKQIRFNKIRKLQKMKKKYTHLLA